MKYRFFKLTLVVLFMLTVALALAPKAANAAPATCNNPGANYVHTTYSSTPGTYQTETREFTGLSSENAGLTIKYYYNYKFTRKQYVTYVLRWLSVFYTKTYCGEVPAPNPIDCTVVIGDTLDPKCTQ
jgi:hypothetical protein